MTISRRTFLSLGGAAVAVGAAGAIAGPPLWRDLVEQHLQQAGGGGHGSGASPRVLVVLDLGGGNDGLNTLVPGDGRYRDARPTLAVPEGVLVELRGTTAYAMHPQLKPLQSWYEAGHLVAVDGVALPQQTRSHFLASDVWWTGQPGAPHGTGWLGRWLDEQTDASNPLRAISLGLPTQALSGRKALPTVVSDPLTFSLMAPKGADAAALTRAFLATAHPASSDAVIAASQQAVPDTLDAVRRLQPALTGPNRVQFPADDATNGEQGSAGSSSVLAGNAKGGTGESVTVTGLLEVAAGIIDLQIGTQVIMVSVTGFDTHADQADRQPLLLADLAQGLDGFLRAVRDQGRADDVLVLTTSEFGGRVAENGSGTDHGLASVQFLAGGRVDGGRVVGTADLAHLDEGDVPLHIDTRSLYAAALDWLGGPTDDILGGRFDRLGLVA